MNKKIVTVILGIMCAVLSCGIAIQVRTIEGTGSIMSTNAQENELRDAVLKAKEKYDNLYADVESAEKKLEEERTNATENNTDLTSLENEIKSGNKILGLTEVTGNGLIITINDNQDISLNNWLADPNLLIVHDADLISVVNELKNAGAEAISINEQRIVNTSEIVYVGNSIVYINQQRILSPYTIKAIGNQTYLESILLGNGGYVDELKKIGFDVDIERSNKISIPKYQKELAHKYIQ